MKKGCALKEIFSSSYNYKAWDGLYEILHNATYDEVIDMLHEGGYDDCMEICMEIDGNVEYGTIFVWGEYADESPIIEFENGVVARWYRQICFD